MILDTLVAAGVAVRDHRVPGYRGWFTPIGVLQHHTASGRNSGDLPSLRVCQRGRFDVPGPLCQVLIGRSGTVAVITDGRGNHAGSGSWTGVRDGNGQLIGIEIENDGRGEPWSLEVLAVVARVTAALTQRFGGLVIGHKEWAPGRKIDPSYDMNAMRAAVLRLTHPPPLPPQIEELLMSLTAFQLRAGNDATVFVPGQRSIPMGGLGGPHVALHGSKVAPVVGDVSTAELVTFAARWDASIS